MDNRWMGEALREATRAFEADEVPVGAVLVYEGHIIARGHNQMETLRDATAHAEMVCLSAAEQESWRLTGCTLYCTLEPCAMCAGAMLLSRLSRLVWGAPDLRHGAHGSWTDLFSLQHPTHTLDITSGVRADEAADLMRTFFEKRRGTPV